MRKSVLLITSMVSAALLACGVALAAEISCPTGPNRLCVGTGQSDTMTGTESRDVMDGRAANDTLNALGGNDRLFGWRGDDILSGGEGNDTYVLASVTFHESIPEGGESGGIDTIDASAVGSLTIAHLGDTGGSVRSLSRASLGFPTAVIENFIGGEVRTRIYGNSFRNRFYGNLGSDIIHRGKARDFLYGGSGTDQIWGDAGNDTLDGGSEGDIYLFMWDFWGNDTVIDTTSSSETNAVEFGKGGTKPEHALTINLVSSDSAPEATNTNGTGTVNWSGDVINDVIVVKPTNDVIVGNPAANRVTSHTGSDTLSTGDGDDTIDVQDGIGDDQVDCGEDGPGETDNDRVRRDAGDTVINC